MLKLIIQMLSQAKLKILLPVTQMKVKQNQTM